ncbi:MAG: hypothetical protein LUD48_06665 [Prevotella sp.]|nr:hypothetical protein [Prevotella sp.]
MANEEKKKAKKEAKEAKKQNKKERTKAQIVWGIIIGVILLVVIVGGIILGIVKSKEINYYNNGVIDSISSIKDGSWEEDGEEAEAVEEIATDFEAGEYGGIQFDTAEDVVNYYVEAYNTTKAETANYIDADGNTAEFYAMLGDEDLSIDSILIDGSENSIINALVPTIVSSIYSSNVYGLPPCNNRTPSLDVDENDESLTTSRLTIDDIDSASVKDNGDGTITITLTPVESEMSHKGMDPAGKLLNVLGSIDETVESISLLSWASGTTEENCQVHYTGTAVVTINTATKEITEADYTMNSTVDVQHASISVIKDKSAVLYITYTQHFPASDEYLKDTKDITRA